MKYIYVVISENNTTGSKDVVGAYLDEAKAYAKANKISGDTNTYNHSFNASVEEVELIED